MNVASFVVFRMPEPCHLLLLDTVKASEQAPLAVMIGDVVVPASRGASFIRVAIRACSASNPSEVLHHLLPRLGF